MPLRLHAARLLSNPALRSPTRACRRRCATASRSLEVQAAKDLSFGQPVYETHGHILQPGEYDHPLAALDGVTVLSSLGNSYTRDHGGHPGMRSDRRAWRIYCQELGRDRRRRDDEIDRACFHHRFYRIEFLLLDWYAAARVFCSWLSD